MLPHVCDCQGWSVLLYADQLDTATKHRAAREAESTDQRQHVFVKLLEQSRFMSVLVFY